MKKKIKTAIAAATIYGLGLISPLMPSVSARTLELKAVHPYSSMESRENINHNINEISGNMTSSFSRKGGSTFYKRAVEGVVQGYFAFASSYLTHEMGHDKEDTSFSSDLVPGSPPIPMTNPSPHIRESDSIKYATGGLNQNAENAEGAWKRLQIEERTLSGIMNMFSNSLYPALYNDNGNTRVGKVTDTDDLDAYVILLEREKGIKTTREEIKQGALLSGLLTLENWKNAYETGKYLLTGKMEKEPFTFKIGENKITPPIITQRLGGAGPIYKATSIINPRGENPISLSAAADKETYRVGGKIYDIKTPIEGLTVSPHAYINFGETPGFEVGAELEKIVNKNLSLTLNAKYSKEDLIKDLERGENGGFKASAGFKYNF